LMMWGLAIYLLFNIDLSFFAKIGIFNALLN